MDYKDYYKILGVSKNADEKEIKRAYRQLAQKYHPDKNPGDTAAEDKFKDINEAYEVIGDPNNRSKYDQLGANYHRYQQMGGNPGDFDFSQWFGNGGGVGGQGGVSDFFEAIFGRGGASNPFTSGGGRPFGGGRSAASYDIEQVVEITLEEAYQGTTRTFSQHGEQFTPKIPVGAKDGTKVRLRGKGNPMPNGGRGNLYLVVKLLPHAQFKRDGDNLAVAVAVDVATAVLGGKVEVPTMTGAVKLSVPAGTQGSQTIRLRGKGMPKMRQKEQFGDLMATINIRIPKNISNEERAIYEQLAALQQGD